MCFFLALASRWIKGVFLPSSCESLDRNYHNHFVSQTTLYIAHLSPSLHKSFSSSTTYIYQFIDCIHLPVHRLNTNHSDSPSYVQPCIWYAYICITSHGRAVWLRYQLVCSRSDIKGLIQLLFCDIRAISPPTYFSYTTTYLCQIFTFAVALAS